MRLVIVVVVVVIRRPCGRRKGTEEAALPMCAECRALRRWLKVLASHRRQSAHRQLSTGIQLFPKRKSSFFLSLFSFFLSSISFFFFFLFLEAGKIQIHKKRKKEFDLIGFQFLHFGLRRSTGQMRLGLIGMEGGGGEAEGGWG